jgi:uncharacterized protein (DUF2062 family)
MPRPSRFRRWSEQLLHTHDTPRRTAAAYALGVFWGFSPVLGLHTVCGLAFAFLLGLNRVAVVLGVYSNLPWILPAYYTVATLAGAGLIGVEVKPQAVEEAMSAVAAMAWGDFSGLREALAPLLWSYTLGSTLGALILAGIAYRVSLSMILAHRRRLVRDHEERPDF